MAHRAAQARPAASLEFWLQENVNPCLLITHFMLRLVESMSPEVIKVLTINLYF